VIFNIAFLIFI